MCSLFCFPRNVCFIQAAWRIMELIVEEALFAAGCWSILLRPLLCFRGTWACASLNFASVGWVGCSCALRFMLYPRNMLPSWHSWYLGSVFCHVLEFQLHIWMLRRGLPCWNLEHYGNLFLLPRFCEFVLGSELSMLAVDVVSSPFNAVASLGVGQHLFAKKLKICAFEDDCWPLSCLSWLVLLSQQSFGDVSEAWAGMCFCLFSHQYLLDPIFFLRYFGSEIL